jgi:hypothetical protein
MLRKAFDLQLNRLFWPEGFIPHQPAARLAAYTRRMLHSRLKAVYYYQSTAPTLAVEGGPRVMRLLQRSRRALPAASTDGPEPLPPVERFRPVRPAEFLGTVAGCFAEQ